jgi:hypothetical protein
MEIRARFELPTYEKGPIPTIKYDNNVASEARWKRTFPQATKSFLDTARQLYSEDYLELPEFAAVKELALKYKEKRNI